MKETEFDKFAEEYFAIHSRSIRVSGESPDFFVEYKVNDAAALLRAKGRSKDVRILDLGAGIGASVPHFRRALPRAHVTCLDVSRKSLELGQSKYGDVADFVHFDGATIPFEDRSFDLVFAACVFHHIDHAAHLGLLREIHRVLVATGSLLIFEHNPLNPLTVRVVKSCIFDEHAKLIRAGQMRRACVRAGFGSATHNYRLFFPAVFRALRPLERHLHWLPLGAQYYVAAEK